MKERDAARVGEKPHGETVKERRRDTASSKSSGVRGAHDGRREGREKGEVETEQHRATECASEISVGKIPTFGAEEQRVLAGRSFSLYLSLPLYLSLSLCFSSERRHIAVGVVSTLIKPRHLIQRDGTLEGRTDDRSAMAAAMAAHH